MILYQAFGMSSERHTWNSYKFWMYYIWFVTVTNSELLGKLQTTFMCLHSDLCNKRNHRVHSFYSTLFARHHLNPYNCSWGGDCESPAAPSSPAEGGGRRRGGAPSLRTTTPCSYLMWVASYLAPLLLQPPPTTVAPVLPATPGDRLSPRSRCAPRCT